MGEISANSRPVDECPLCSGLGIAYAGDIIDVAVDPIQYRHDLSDPVAGTPELTLREPHELSEGQKRLGSRNATTRRIGTTASTNNRRLPRHQRALDFFESGFGLGRPISWAFEGNRLIVVPHAGYGKNADLLPMFSSKDAEARTMLDAAATPPTVWGPC